MRRTRSSAARAARDPKFAAAIVILVSCALISAVNLGSDDASAETGPKNVRGYVYDSVWNPVAGANVTIKMLNGMTLVKTLYYDATEPDGLYTVTFGGPDWGVNYTIETTASYDGSSAVNSTVAVAGPSQWVNVTLSGYVIPEFGSSITMGLTIASLAAMVVVLTSRRRRRA